jgi:hypothetical protein
MKRRQLVKGMAATLGGMLVLPAWAEAWTPAALSIHPTQLSSLEETLLAEIVESIIPKTDTPGAKELEVQRFISAILTDCYDQKSRDVFTKGLQTVEQLSQKSQAQSFLKSTPEQRLAVLSKMAESDDLDTKSFARMVKNLTIRGYLSSEFVMTKLKGYQMAPGFYDGCVPVKA